MNKLPLFELQINEDEDAIVSAVSLVEDPAIESNFIAFSNHQMNFKTNDERQELIGAAMIPNMKIYRRDQNGNEYNVFFSTDTIRKISQVYFKKGFQKNMNISHSSTPAHSYIFQSYLVDSNKGITAPKGLDVPDGSWIIGVKVDDTEVWNKIKTGEVKGFSIEGLFEFINSDMFSNEVSDEQLLSLINRLNEILTKQNKNND